MSSASSLLDALRGLISFAVLIPILVAVHELGHFWAARAFGMKVDAFAVMMGGVRKTNLDGTLLKPLVSAKIPWFVGVLSATALIVSAEMKFDPGVYAALVSLGLALPVWVVTRLGALYHLPVASSIGTLAKVWGLAVLLSFLGTKGHGLPLVQLVGLIALASFVATLIVYYHPVFHKGEESPNGLGQVLLPQGKVVPEAKRIDPNTGRALLPVRFRPLASRTDKHGTEFSLLCWPLGGFAAIHGMHPKEDGSETQITGGFYSKPPLARFIVLFAGPLFSILFGVLILTGLKTVTGKPIPDQSAKIGAVDESGPGAKSGLKVGDRIVTINGKPVASFYDVVKDVRYSYRKLGDKYEPVPVFIGVERDGRQFNFKATPRIDPEPQPLRNEKMEIVEELAVQAKLGIGPSLTYAPLSLGEAFVDAARTPVDLVSNLAHSVAKPATLAQNIGGPASIAKEVTEASKLGFDVVLTLGGLLSISLGVMNLLPIVPFDGGQMTVAFAEMLRGGRRLSLQFQTAISTIGAFLVIALILGIVTLDISHMAQR
ncbi:MAG: site-2 protease family protein [Armatimonadetes bacterium]|nr:site-2 protease family protein [Armatimonadota bacterium]